jgi:hypothetical protein
VEGRAAIGKSIPPPPGGNSFTAISNADHHDYLRRIHLRNHKRNNDRDLTLCQGLLFTLKGQAIFDDVLKR